MYTQTHVMIELLMFIKPFCLTFSPLKTVPGSVREGGLQPREGPSLGCQQVPPLPSAAGGAECQGHLLEVLLEASETSVFSISPPLFPVGYGVWWTGWCVIAARTPSSVVTYHTAPTIPSQPWLPQELAQLGWLQWSIFVVDSLPRSFQSSHTNT